MDEILKERLAELAHEQWSGWMRYLFEKSTNMPDGTVRIPKNSVDRWKRQMTTAYENLSESEKHSDRLEAQLQISIMNYYVKNSTLTRR